MNLRLQHLIFAALVVALVSLAYGINYMYITDCEQTTFGDRNLFWTSDTFQGAVHSNSLIAIEGSPVYYGQVSTTECDFWHGPGYNPIFLGPPPQFRAPRVEFPWQANGLRECAASEGWYFSQPDKSYRVILHGDSARVCISWTGLPFDTAQFEDVALYQGRCMFFDGPLELKGSMTGQLSIGSSQTILLTDNVLYDDADAHSGIVPSTSSNYLMVLSEGDIKIANTYQNGRNDSNLGGLEQTNWDSTSIVLDGYYVALGEKFTFEQQNDPDSGYVFQDPPGTPHRDDRGTIYLYGALAQKRRGYVHRASNLSTGYLKHYRWDPRFTNWTPPGAPPFDLPNGVTTDSIEFGGMLIGHTASDTAHIYPDGSCNLGSVIATAPFHAVRVPPYFSNQFHIPVSFTPTEIGNFNGILYIYTPYRYYQIVLHGRGLPGGAPPHLVISPNPFNLSTTLRYAITEAGAVRITLYDVLGRTARQIDLGAQEPGQHSAQLNASDLASGVYFVRFQIKEHAVTQKILLLK